jgi:hypothetical protein
MSIINRQDTGIPIYTYYSSQSNLLPLWSVFISNKDPRNDIIINRLTLKISFDKPVIVFPGITPNALDGSYSKTIRSDTISDTKNVSVYAKDKTTEQYLPIYVTKINGTNVNIAVGDPYTGDNIKYSFSKINTITYETTDIFGNKTSATLNVTLINPFTIFVINTQGTTNTDYIDGISTTDYTNKNIKIKTYWDSTRALYYKTNTFVDNYPSSFKNGINDSTIYWSYFQMIAAWDFITIFNPITISNTDWAFDIYNRPSNIISRLSSTPSTSITPGFFISWCLSYYYLTTIKFYDSGNLNFNWCFTFKINITSINKSGSIPDQTKLFELYIDSNIDNWHWPIYSNSVQYDPYKGKSGQGSSIIKFNIWSNYIDVNYAIPNPSYDINGNIINPNPTFESWRNYNNYILTNTEYKSGIGISAGYYYNNISNKDIYFSIGYNTANILPDPNVNKPVPKGYINIQFYNSTNNNLISFKHLYSYQLNYSPFHIFGDKAFIKYYKGVHYGETIPTANDYTNDIAKFFKY